MALFNSCYAPEDGGSEEPQSGCGLVGVGALEPLVEQLKKSVLSASEAVIKRLRKRQHGAGKKKRKRQTGFGHKKKHKKQRGRGKKKQSGAGKKKQRGAGKKKR